MWCIPPHQNAAFVAAMKDVLEVYSRPYDPKRPVVCMDEQLIELHADSRKPIGLSESNHTEKVDHEYIGSLLPRGVRVAEIDVAVQLALYESPHGELPAVVHRRTGE